MADQLDTILFGEQDTQTFQGSTQLDSILFSESQQVQEQQNKGKDLSQFFGKDQDSPLSLKDRVLLSFADDTGREKFLRERFSFVTKLENGKFAVGDNPKDVQPIDPEGLFNDVLGDIADVVSEIPVVAGQIAGSIAGTPGGPGTLIAGGALGAGAGEAVRQGIGKSLGVNKSDPTEMATDIAVVLAFGGAGEALGPLFKGFSKTKQFQNFGQMMSSLIKKVSPGTKNSLDTIFPKIVQFTSGTKPAAATRYMKDSLFDLSPRKTAFFLDETSGARLAKRASRAMGGKRAKLGQEVGEATSELVANTKSDIPIGDVHKALVDGLKLNGVIDPETGIYASTKIVEGTDLRSFRLLLESVDDPRFKFKSQIDEAGKVIGRKKEKVFAANENQKMNVKQLVEWKRDLDSVYDSLSDEGRALARQVRGGIQQKLQDTAIKTNSTRFLKANSEFSKFVEALDVLRENGVDYRSAGSLENFGKSFFARNQTQRNAFTAVDQMIPESQIVNNLADWGTFQELNKARGNILRFQFIAGLLGASLLPQSPEGKAIATVSVLASASPSGVRAILKAGGKLKGVSKARIALPKVGPNVKEGAEAILSRLVQHGTVGRSTEQPTQRP